MGPSSREQAADHDQTHAGPLLDLDISHANLPTGTRLAVGDLAVIEVTAKPHHGCKEFLRYFGEDAVTFVNSEEGKTLRLRRLNARVVTGGTVRPGDEVRKF